MRSLIVPFGLTAFLVAGGCVTEQDPESAQQAVTTENGLSFNGLTRNGLSFNGLSFNGLSFNGIASNGLSFNGLSFNGLSFNGIGTNGLSFNGLSFNGLSFNGLSFNGIGTNGVGVNGLGLNGLSFNGLSFNGLSFNGGTIDLVSLAALDPAKVRVREDATVRDLRPEERAQLDIALYHLVGCALDRDESVTLGGDKGTVFYGERGFATEWRNEPLSTAGNESVRACVESATDEWGRPVRPKAVQIALNPDQIENLKILLRYFIECALADGQLVDVTFPNEKGPIRYSGLFGLALGYRTGNPTAEDRHGVSACLGARANKNGQTVAISLRGMGLSVTAVERETFEWHEGAFWGDVMSEEPYLRTCGVSGGISGRECAEEGGCDVEYLGNCAVVCAGIDADDAAYHTCGPEGETAVINVFMNLGTRIAFGALHSCGISDDGAVWCWGGNDDGQVGHPDIAAGRVIEAPHRVPMPNNEPAIEVVATARSTCARLRSGSLYCWGENWVGQLGTGGSPDSTHVPAHVSALGSDVANLSGGVANVVAVRTDGTVWTWGLDYFGGPNVFVPQLFDDAPGAAVAASAAGTHACTVDGAGALWCWGDNSSGQLGDATTKDSTVPVPAWITDVADVCTSNSLTCARRTDDSVWCWGNNYYGQLGAGATAAMSTVPLHVMDGAAADTLVCGDAFACAATNGGEARCWGLNAYGQLASAPTTTVNGAYASRVPVRIEFTDGEPLVEIDELYAGVGHVCARRTDDSVWCWGLNIQGSLGSLETFGQMVREPTWSDHFSHLPVCGDSVCEAGESGSCEVDCPSDPSSSGKGGDTK